MPKHSKIIYLNKQKFNFFKKILQITLPFYSLKIHTIKSKCEFFIFLYKIVKEAHLGFEINGIWEDLPLLTWNESKSWKENMQEKAFNDPQVKVILVGEKGNYR
ncbi:MAG: hypothetical protein J1D99_01960 [Campylobacter sp.]|nr:hypothetical protein [Campylobacter sp.]